MPWWPRPARCSVGCKTCPRGSWSTCCWPARCTLTWATARWAQTIAGLDGLYRAKTSTPDPRPAGSLSGRPGDDHAVAVRLLYLTLTQMIGEDVLEDDLSYRS